MQSPIKAGGGGQNTKIGTCTNCLQLNAYMCWRGSEEDLWIPPFALGSCQVEYLSNNICHCPVCIKFHPTPSIAGCLSKSWCRHWIGHDGVCTCTKKRQQFGQILFCPVQLPRLHPLILAESLAIIRGFEGIAAGRSKGSNLNRLFCASTVAFHFMATIKGKKIREGLRARLIWDHVSLSQRKSGPHSRGNVSSKLITQFHLASLILRIYIQVHFSFPGLNALAISLLSAMLEVVGCLCVCVCVFDKDHFGLCVRYVSSHWDEACEKEYILPANHYFFIQTVRSRNDVQMMLEAWRKGKTQPCSSLWEWRRVQLRRQAEWLALPLSGFQKGINKWNLFPNKGWVGVFSRWKRLGGVQL